MSPFSIALRQLRIERGIAQGDFAARLGFRQAYISQLERGNKLPKDDNLVPKIVGILNLTPEHETVLRQAFETSRQFEVPPLDASPAAYSYCAQLSEALPALSVADFKILSTVLECVRAASRPPENHDRRSTPQPVREIPM
jgi:transcriptional regulator with XRE-family HTH domain